MTETDDQKLEQLVRLAGHRTPLPEEARSRFEESFRKELQATRNRRLRHRLQFASGIAACLVLAVALLLVRNQPVEVEVIATVERSHGQTFWQHDEEGGPLRSGNQIQPNDIIRTSAGSLAIRPRAVNIDIRLDRMTEIEFIDGQSMRLIKGSVYINVPSLEPEASAGLQPFTTLVNGIAVNHIGTQYLVSSTEQGISVAVREGEVMIATNHQRHRSRATDKGAELVEIHADHSITKTRIVTYGERWAWANILAPDIETDGMYLVDFLDWVARETGFTIAYASPDIRLLVQGKDGPILRGSRGTENVFKALGGVMRNTQFIASIDAGVITIQYP